MPLTPSQILAANSGGPTGGSSISALLARHQQRQDVIAQALANETEYKPSGQGFWGQAKAAAGDAVGGLGRTLDAGRAAVVAGAAEAGDVLRHAAGKETFGSKGGASWEDVKSNFNRRVGVGDLLEENTLTKGLPMNAKRGLAFVGDTAADPLNAVGGGTNAAAKATIGRVSEAAGEDVARILVTQGEKAADDALVAAAKAAPVESLAARSANPTEHLAQTLERSRAGTATAVKEAPAPKTIRGILADAGVEGDAAEKALGHVAATGKGGIRVSLLPGNTKTLMAGETIGALPGAQALKSGVEWSKHTGLGKATREALVPYTRVRDKFGDAVAAAMPGIGHGRTQFIKSSVSEFESALEPYVKGMDDVTKTQITAALDVGGNADMARAALEADGLPEAAKALDTLVEGRDRAYQTLLDAGAKPENLMAKDEYLRHSLTPAGAEKLGIDRDAFRTSSTKTGTFKERKRLKDVLGQNEDFGFNAYETDPVNLVRGSFEAAQTVGGNKLAFDSLEDLAKKTGEEITSRVPKEGFTKIAPDAYIHDSIYDSIIKMRKAGADNSIVQGWDAFTGILKRYTLFGPIAFGPYFTQNMATGVSMNAAKFGVGPTHYFRNLKLMNAIKEAEHAGVRNFTTKGVDHFDEALRAALPDPTDYKMARGLWDNGVVDPKGGTYDDLASVTPGGIDDTKFKQATRAGTNKTVKINAFGEEMLRGSAFVKSMEDGLTASEAAKLVRDTHLDYSALGKTAFERNAINRFIFFPTWLLRAPKAIVGAYIQKPGLAMAQMRLEQGTHWYDRQRNDYGDVLGPRLSGPGSFLVGLGQGQLPIDGGEILNPLAKAVLNTDKDARTLQGIVPPAAQWTRANKVKNDEDARNRYAGSMVGVRTGVDYGGERAVKDLQDRIAEREQLGGEATPSQTLAMRAVDILGPKAAGFSTKELVIELADAGMKVADIRRILSAPYKSVERPDMTALPPGELDRMLESGMNPNEIRDLLVNG